MLKTKSIMSPKEYDDGIRISIMSRHTLNDGKTPHPQITKSSYDKWIQQLAPPDKLIGNYYKRWNDLSQLDKWKKFEKEYLEYIRQPEIEYLIELLSNNAIHTTVTLLCIEDTPQYCHRRLLAEECKIYQPNLELIIR